MEKKPISNCIGELAWPDVKWFLKKSDVVIIPIGSLEQHSAHLPLLMDTHTCMDITIRVSKMTDIPYYPAIWMGYSPHHLKKAGEGYGTVTLRPSTYANLLYDVAKSVVYHGWNKIIFHNGHGSNMKIMDPILRKIRYETGAYIGLMKPYAERDLDFVRDILEGPIEDTPGWHCGEWETSVALAHHEKFVHMERAVQEHVHTPKWIPPEFKKEDGAADVKFLGQRFFVFPMEHMEFTDSGTIGNPFVATKEKGEKILKRYAEYCAKALEIIKKWKVDESKIRRDFNNRCDW